VILPILRQNEPGRQLGDTWGRRLHGIVDALCRLQVHGFGAEEEEEYIHIDGE